MAETEPQLSQQKNIEIPITLPYQRAMKYYHLTNSSIQKIQHPDNHIETWEPPITGLKVIVDGSYDYGSTNGGAGGVIRNNRGNLVA